MTSLCGAGIEELNLRGLPVELEDVRAVLLALPGIRVIHLSGARKLPPHAVSALLCQPASDDGEPACTLPMQLSPCCQWPC